MKAKLHNSAVVFQSTRPWGARHTPPGKIIVYSLFQSTRPWGARHFDSKKSVVDMLISIHAPMRGATSTLNVCSPSLISISIHAPMRGATCAKKLLVFRHWKISIHAPMRGATNQCQSHCRRLMNFNPRAHEGRDNNVPFPLPPSPLFQSTRP